MLSDRARAQVALVEEHGRLALVLAQPFTVMRAYARKLLSR